MSFLCTIRNKEVSYHQCVNECQYFFKSGCIDKMNEAYNQGKADVIDEIIEYYKPCDDCCACLENDRDYFKKKCEMDIQMSYTELVEDLKKLKEQKK